MIQNRRTEILAQLLMAAASSLLVAGLLLTPNVVLADEDPLPPAPVACKNCRSGGANECPGQRTPCNSPSRLCRNQSGKTGCGNCICQEVPNSDPKKCDCYPF
jgi:hypothetical protein